MRPSVRFGRLGGLRARLILPVVLAAVPATWIVLQTADTWRRHEVADALSAGIQLTRHAAAVHARTLHHAHRTLATIASAADAMDPPAFERLLRAAVQGASPFATAGVLQDGDHVVAFGKIDGATEQRLRALAAQAGDAGGVAVGEYVAGGPGYITLMLAEPVPGPAVGRARRFAFGTVELAWLDEAIDRATVPPGSVITVFDRHARILARDLRPAGGVEAEPPAAAVIQAALSTAGEGTTEAGDSAPRVYAYAPLYGPTPPEHLYMSVAIPKAVATAAADRALRRTAGALLLASAFAGAVAWVSSGRLSREVAALATTMARLSGGDMTARTGVENGTPELARLATALDSLAALVAEREHEILRRQHELSQQDSRLRAAVETGLDQVMLFDAGATVLYASPSAVQMDGYHVDEVIGRQAFEFVHPDDCASLRAQFSDVAGTPSTSARTMFRVRTKSGSWRWIEADITNMLQDPRVAAIVGKYRDITESRDAEDERRRLQDALESRVLERTTALMAANQALLKLSSALEQTADSVFITDAGGVIEYVNPAFEAMTGYTRAEAVGATPRLVSSGVHDKRFYESMWTTILKGGVFRAIVTNKTKDGRVFNEDQSITPIRAADGEITHFVSTGRDITERKRSEQALRRLNAALENEAARIAAVLHDEAGQFLSSAHITLADVAREVTPDQRERIQQVRHHLDLAEVQLRRVSHELHPHMLSDLGLTEAVRFLASTCARRNRIVVDVDVTLGAPCPSAVQTVFYRLVQEGLANIAKHARASHASIVLGQTETAFYCSIDDDGVGFDAAPDENRDDFSLGLTLMRDRIEAVGGTLAIVSVPQRGTSLRATVPTEH